MQLLDASLAFALTLAALATVVTIIMEISFRVVRMRKKNLIEVMKLLNDELGKSSLEMSPEERWQFFSKVVENPVYAVQLVSKIDWPESDEKNESVFAGFLNSFGKIKDRKGIYSKVTLEYVLRCLAESDSVKRAYRESSEKLKGELNRIARKYEEFGSAVSAGFKQYAQACSIVIGILLAFAANVDGLRIFEAYRSDPKLAAAVIEKEEAFIEKNKQVQDSMERLKALYLEESDIKSRLEDAQLSVADKDALEKELAVVQDRITDQSEMANIQKAIQDAKNQVSELSKLGVPIGWEFFPSCPEDLSSRFICIVAWLFKVAITGILIGLGAPFWFDVAKRLSMIRRGLKNPNASAEDRLAARDANGDPDERNKIVEDVAADIAIEAAAQTFGLPCPFMGPKGLIL